jgi:hypothetical protein
VVGESVDVEDDSAGNVLCQVSRESVDWRSYSDGRKGSVQDDKVGIAETFRQPERYNERIHEDLLSLFVDSRAIVEKF